MKTACSTSASVHHQHLVQNFRPAKEIKVDQNCGIKTRSKPIFSGATSIRETRRDMPWTDQNGKARFTELLLALKRLDAKNSSLPERDTAEQPQQWSQQLTSSLCLWAGAAEPPPCSYMSCRTQTSSSDLMDNHHGVKWGITLYSGDVKRGITHANWGITLYWDDVKRGITHVNWGISKRCKAEYSSIWC